MKARATLIAGISLIAIAGLILYTRRRHKIYRKNQQVSKEVSEHGYETAHDILFPPKKKRTGKYKYRPA